jgi:hypothetical protein
MAERKAAIDRDALMDRPMADLSAAELLRALSSPTVATEAVMIADKKKYELWVEESTVLKLSLADIIEKIRGEKKKVELELDPIWRWKVNPPVHADYGRLVEDVAALVEQRIGGR